MTQTFRSREDQVDALYHGHNTYSTITQEHFRQELVIAEARGAAEERGKGAEGQEPVAWLVEQRGVESPFFTQNKLAIESQFITGITPLYARPANVAALEADRDKWRNQAHYETDVAQVAIDRGKTLEARIAELEEEVAKLNGGIRNPDDVTCALMDSQYVAGAKFGWNCAQDDDPEILTKMIERRLRDRIEAGVSFSDRSRDARAALKREGGV